MYVALIDRVPLLLQVERDGADATVTVPLTIRDDGRSQVAVEVRMWGGHWRGVAMHEFKYAIVVLDGVTGDLLEIFDREEAAAYIAPVQHLILPIVRAAAMALVAAVAPDVIYRATFLCRPPEKTLPKHQMITDMFKSLDYRILQEGVDAHQRWFWLLTKSGAAR